MKPIVAIACSKSKLHYAAPVRLLYVGAAFKECVRYAERNGLTWFVISAKHGLVKPDCILAPYNETLTQLTKKQQEEWSQRVAKQIAQQYPNRQFIVLAGALYASAFKGLKTTEPLKGLSQGKRLAQLKKL